MVVQATAPQLSVCANLMWASMQVDATVHVNVTGQLVAELHVLWTSVTWLFGAPKRKTRPAGGQVVRVQVGLPAVPLELYQIGKPDAQ